MHPATPAQRPIRRRKLYEEVALRIEEMIREGRYAPGDQLPAERELMEELGVGRSAVREAMLSLQKMGLVTVNSGERARVTIPTAQVLVSELAGAARLLLAQEGGVERFQEARALFEIGLARLAAQRATPEDLARLEAALEANRAAIGDREQFMRTDVAFHYAIATIPRNDIFTSVHNAVVEWLTEQRDISGRAPGAGEAAYAAHRRIYEAIAAHDPVAAEQAMQDHLDAVVKLYWRVRQSAPGA
ncbi:MAG: transcriptional regulator NanR [Rhodospirillaceae bacterium]|nr:transcriptional regulator NanR [Rhodospirillaceae bacterium]